MKLKLKIEGAIYGFLVGEGIGLQLGSNYPLPRSYAEGGAMTLCTMHSLSESNDIDYMDIMATFEDWYLGLLFAPKKQIKGRTTISESLRLFGSGMPPDRCGAMNTDNTALIRMLPIALWCLNNSRKLIEESHNCTLLTNQTIESEITSAIYSLMLRGLIVKKTQKITELLEEYYKDTTYQKKLKLIMKKQDKHQQTEEAIDSLWTSWSIFKNNPNDFETTMKKLPKKLPPSTIALIGSFLGAKNGINEIPQKMIRNMDLSDDVQRTIVRFSNTTSNTYANAF